jgi:malate dehydrogenase (oxaloacetate-decarboxylating)
MPVMEGKAVLFKQFGGVDAVPICLDTQDSDEIVAIVTALAPSFGGINLEDIAAPRCFEIERRLDEALSIPVFHDDQHGTAIVVLAALRNAAALLQRKLGELRIVVSGAGAAGVAVTKMLLAACSTQDATTSTRPRPPWPPRRTPDRSRVAWRTPFAVPTS